MTEMTGGCLCGAVQYEITGEFVGIINCHCKDCQRLHGIYNPMIVVEKTDFALTDDSGIAWYESSPEKERGFCKKCGAALFMKQTQGPKMLISVGSLDETDDLKTLNNIFEEEAGNYYVTPPTEG